ncbi:MAG TPA: universal stress protein [Flavihumibacter sp.]|nr:universal stress protein [Bacteroidota bacterium]HOA38378.1 universal stress protein [Flavihumibacter sp.]HQD10978.1 universal stress protein [Flavihumibacter sp.]
MATIVLITNFSTASRNALDYTCRFMEKSKASLLLLNIFSFPGSISDDPIALAAMSEIIYRDEIRLQREAAWVREHFPTVHVRAEMETGVFMDVLRAKAANPETAFLVIGSKGTYNDLLSWEVNIVDAFVDLRKPVLVVPEQLAYKPVEKIAFACNYYRDNLAHAAALLSKIVRFTGAALTVIHVKPPHEIIGEEGTNNKQALQAQLAELQPTYVEPAFPKIIAAIDQYTAAEKIDLLVVIPSRHGIWDGIFRRTHTTDIVHLNHLPLLSLRQTASFPDVD